MEWDAARKSLFKQRRRAFIAFTLILSSCGSPPPAPIEESSSRYVYRDHNITNKSPVARKQTSHHVVRSQETLYSIAWQFGLNYKSLAQWNGIRYPYTIYPGQKLRLFADVKKKDNVVKTDKAVAATSAKSGKEALNRSKNKQSAKNKFKNAESVTVQKNWQWPTNGHVVSQFRAGDKLKQGVDITGQMGQAVFAANSGEVVYSGSGLKGYGNLIIVKHNVRYLTAYGYNARHLVKEGEKVHGGQQIAKMGLGPTKKPMLHFEIRLDGNPINPLQFLPTQ